MSAYDPSSSSEFSAVTHTLIRVAETLDRTSDQLAQIVQNLGRFGGLGTEPGAAVATAPTAQINIFEDDPFSESTPSSNPATAGTAPVDLPINSNPLLQVRITTSEPAAALYSAETANFRHWTAKEALTRAINFWSP